MNVAAKANGPASRRSCRPATRPMSSARPSLRWPPGLSRSASRSWSSTIRARTGRRARRGERGRGRRVTVLEGESPPPGWAGKVWAMAQGVAAAEAAPEPPDYLLFVDADIVLEERLLRRLIAFAEAKRAALASLMVKLRCESPAERWLVPAFIFFFQMLYPFSWVDDPRRRTAAAAGGCMLVHRQSLAEAGGLAALRGALIDDCALAALMKRRGRIWLSPHAARGQPALLSGLRGLRPDGRAFGFRRAALLRAASDRSPWPRWGSCSSRLRCWSSFRGARRRRSARPPGRSWRSSSRRRCGSTAGRSSAGLALPAIAAAYMLFTVQSAAQYWTGRGGLWKGRVQAPMPKAERV